MNYVNLLIDSMIGWCIGLIVGFSVMLSTGFSLLSVLPAELSENHNFIIQLVQIVAPLVCSLAAQLWVNRKEIRRLRRENKQPLNKPYKLQEEDTFIN